MPLETLVIDPNYSIQRTILTPQLRSQVGDGRVRIRRQSARPVYQFTLIDRQQNAATADALWQFARRHQGDTPFWYSGDQWGALASPVLVGEGDGAQTTFWLPNRYLLETPAVYLNGSFADPQPLTNLLAGQIVFVAAPGAGVVITAQYNCQYRVLFWYQDEGALSADLFYKGLFSTGILLREFIDAAAAIEAAAEPMTQLLYMSTWELDPEANLTLLYFGVNF